MLRKIFFFSFSSVCSFCRLTVRVDRGRTGRIFGKRCCPNQIRTWGYSRALCLDSSRTTHKITPVTSNSILQFEKLNYTSVISRFLFAPRAKTVDTSIAR
ncbi:hypothetical protein EJ08DRAFT_273642 [Tothia fuscella]|uniref:Secreted protein n=1 Tax=Tothia fuscella TaxID=1048955 RepID=A0A9P4NP68_9PEZI|nr:hypothetical protein EJ08DRAFT_273642 [Tothia fuscella]